MGKKWALIIGIPLLLACIFSFEPGWKELDLNSFKITVPLKWNYIKEQGQDSFIGKIQTSESELTFDYSNQGYANKLIPPESTYIESGEWMRSCYFCKPGVTYTAKFNVQKEKIAQMKKLGTTDSTLVHVEADPSSEMIKKIDKPTSEQKLKYPKADYIAKLTYSGENLYVPIEIPIIIKSHFITIDTTEKYIVKTIWPKVTGQGMTGIYILGRSSHFNFQMNGKNLSKQDQESALKAFKTITFNK